MPWVKSEKLGIACREESLRGYLAIVLQSLAIAIIRRLLIAGCIAIHTGKRAAEMTFRGAKRIHKDPEEEKMMVPKLMVPIGGGGAG